MWPQQATEIFILGPKNFLGPVAPLWATNRNRPSPPPLRRDLSLDDAFPPSACSNNSMDFCYILISVLDRKGGEERGRETTEAASSRPPHPPPHTPHSPSFFTFSLLLHFFPPFPAAPRTRSRFRSPSM